ncbi:NAD(P)-dependent oxidoreductase [archaeon]|nr:NAD(P)-dependent oxidoreductase [archaeon]
MEKKKMLITGGAGYIGSVVSEHFVNLGYDVTVLDNLMYNQNSLLHLFHRRNFHFIYGDVREENLLKSILPKFDVILPLAAIVGAGASEKHPEITNAINFRAIENINKMRDQKRQIIIFPTTNSGYGTKSGDVFCTEETPLEPISVYGTTKVESERVLLKSENAITLRLATCFGFSPRMRLDLLVNNFVYKASKDGYIVLFEKHFKRNYLHVRDAARCFEHCINNFDSMKNEPYNVGLEEANLSKEELALKVKAILKRDTGKDFHIQESEIGKDPDKRNYIISNKKIMATGFRCAYSLEDGIEELIKGYAMLYDRHYTNY